MSDDLNFWKLCDRLTIAQAALLICGYDPSEYADNVERWSLSQQPRGYPPTRQALRDAIQSGALKGELGYDPNEGFGEHEQDFCAHDSSVEVDDLRRWLASKNVRTGFFAAADDNPRPYMDPNHARYAPKLAAAVAAWEAVGEEPVDGKSVKQQIEAWARRHANEFGLCGEDGNPIKAAMDDIAKVANWETKGGAPRTPSDRGTSSIDQPEELVLPQGEERFGQTSEREGRASEMDIEPPF